MRKREATIKDTGFTLIEVVVIILVAAIIMPVMILPFVEGVRDLDTPVTRGTLAFLAQEEMEKKVICFNYQSVSAWSSTAVTGFPGYYSEGLVDSTATFGEVTSGVKEITVTVSKGNESLSLVTVKTDWE